MKLTISVEVGKGSVNHNSRKFKAEECGHGARRYLNIDYCNERIQDVYQMLFGPAQERFNARQTRADRRIPTYYEICTGHQEKPFHEIIIQIGNKDDMSTLGENAELAKTVLNEYYQGFHRC